MGISYSGPMSIICRITNRLQLGLGLRLG